MTLRHLPRRQPTSLVEAAYAAERDAVLLRRVRNLTLPVLTAIAVAACLNVYTYWDDPHLAAHLATLGLQAAIQGVALALSFVPAVRRWARGLAVGLAVGMASVQLWAIALAGTDAAVMLSAVLAVMLVPMLAFPWGMAAQTAISLPLAAGYLAIVPWTDLAPATSGNMLIGTLIGFMVSASGAWLLDQQRRATFLERHRVEALARQSERLLEVGRQLNGTMDVDALVELVTRLGRQLLDCDLASLALFDPAGHQWHMVAVSRDREEPRRLTFTAKDRVAEVAELLERQPLVEISGDHPSPALRDFTTRYGFNRSLFVTVERDGSRLGILSFSQRRSNEPFSESQRQLAGGIAHQAAIALANARLVEDLQQASRIKSEFVSTMSHELRTPLNVILGFSEIARDLSAGNQTLVECLGKIDAAGHDLLDLIEGTLALGKLEAKRDVVTLVSTPLPPLWASLREVCERFPRAESVALEWSMDPPPVALMTDAQKLAIVIRNLVGNALKFTMTGCVQVGASLHADGVALAVVDTGIGIRPEDQARVFEMFQQADGSDARRFGGTGLGLYIARQYVDQLRGTIRLESEPGRGTTFTVVLPVAVEAAQHAA